MDELWQQTKGKYVPGQEVEARNFPKQIAFNCIPHIDVFMEDGYTKEEWKMLAETKKILDPKIRLTATCVRVPVFVGHCESVNIEFEKPLSADAARRMGRFLAELLAPTGEPVFLKKLGFAALETIAMSALGTLLAVIGGLALALPASRVHAGDPARWRVATRLVLNGLRSIPELVWASTLI